MTLAYVALGANLGDAAAALQQALKALQQLPLTELVKTSSVYQTAPLDTDSRIDMPAPGNDYLNAVVALNTSLTAPALLGQLQQIEQLAGRERSYRNAPRTLDLDLLLYGSGRIDSTHLTVPHPRMMQRAFVLMPLAEIAPELVRVEDLEAVSHQAIKRFGALKA